MKIGIPNKDWCSWNESNELEITIQERATVFFLVPFLKACECASKGDVINKSCSHKGDKNDSSPPIPTGNINSFQSLSIIPIIPKTNSYREYQSFLIPILIWNTNPNREYQSSSDIPIRSNPYRQHQS